MGLRRAGKIVYDDELVGRTSVFRDRADAGRRLGDAVKELARSVRVVYAVPRGGIPVGLEVAYRLGAAFDVIVCRKLLIPWNPEAGFGAVDPSGEYFVDRRLVAALGLAPEEVERAVEEQRAEVKRRLQTLRGCPEYPRLGGAGALLVDDGIAAGYTMSASVAFVKRLGAGAVYVAVPTCHLDSASRIAEEVELLVCLNPRTGPVFAVADAYVEWRDLADDDVLPMLEEARRKGVFSPCPGSGARPKGGGS